MRSSSHTRTSFARRACNTRAPGLTRCRRSPGHWSATSCADASRRYSGSRASCATRHHDIVESALRDWRAVLTVMGGRPYFFGDEPTGIDAVVFGALATSVFTPIESPIRDFLRSQPGLVAYAERMRAHFFPELAVMLYPSSMENSMEKPLRGSSTRLTKCSFHPKEFILELNLKIELVGEIRNSLPQSE